ncbi:MAG: ribonuclease PH [Bacillota bacterium]
MEKDSYQRKDGRKAGELRPIKITPSYLRNPEGSALIELGDTRVICTASIEEKVPPFLNGQGQGWVTAEYAMLPRSTAVRVNRERAGANARSLEIQRLIGRSLRAATDLKSLGERTIKIDCDVLQADGGTRTAAISGSFVALVEAFMNLIQKELLTTLPVEEYLSAVSVGLVNNCPLLDLTFEEDSAAGVDMNVIMTSSGKLVEVQGSAEVNPFSRAQLDKMLDLAASGVLEITVRQKDALGPELDKLINKTDNHN